MSRGFKWIRNGALFLVIAAFVFLYGPGAGNVGQGVVAEVDGVPISRDVFEIWRESISRGIPEVEGLDPTQQRDLIDARAVNSLIQRFILANEAERLGLQVPNAALRHINQRNPRYHLEGRYDPELVELAAAQQGYSIRQYLEEIRMDLLVQDFQRFVTSPVRVSDAQVRANIVEAETTVRLRFAVAEAESFREGLELAPEDVKEFLDTHPEEIQAEYESRDEFDQPEQVVARHILFTGPDALEQAGAARARLDAGEGFADLALELSQDEATRERAGLLGPFPRGRMLQAFEEAAFALEVGEISDPVETERGAHLILVEAQRPAISSSLEDAGPQLAHELLLEERAAETARAAGEDLLATLALGEPFIAAAEASGLRIGTTSLFRLSERAVPELRDVEGILAAAYALSEPNAFAPRVFEGGDSFYVISLLEREEPLGELVEEQLPVVREQLLDLTRRNTLQLWLEARYRELEGSGELRIYPLYPLN